MNEQPVTSDQTKQIIQTLGLILNELGLIREAIHAGFRLPVAPLRTLKDLKRKGHMSP